MSSNKSCRTWLQWKMEKEGMVQREYHSMASFGKSYARYFRTHVLHYLNMIAIYIGATLSLRGTCSSNFLREVTSI